MTFVATLKCNLTIHLIFDLSWLEFISFVERALPLPSPSVASSPSQSRDGGRGLETPPSRPVWETRQPLKGVSSREGRRVSPDTTLDQRDMFEEQQRILGNNYSVMINTVKAPISGHPWEAEKVSTTGTGHLQECVNYTEFV